MNAAHIQWWQNVDEVWVSCKGAEIDVQQVKDLASVVQQVEDEGAVAQSCVMTLVPRRELFGNDMDRVMVPAEAVRLDDGRLPDHLILIRDGAIHSWVAREDLTANDNRFRMQLRGSDPLETPVVMVRWKESPNAQFERMGKPKGQPSSIMAKATDAACLDSNPFAFKNQLRKWHALNYLREANSAELLTQDSAFWGSGEWKGLLVLHGTALQSHVGLRHLQQATVKSLCDAYSNRVIALDHKTLENTVPQNVRELLDRMPQNRKLKLDILAISRGAMVARYLAEGHAAEYLASRGQTLEVRKVVFVGGANDGTPSAGKPGILNAVNNLAVSKCMACRKCFSGDTPNKKRTDSIGFAEMRSAIGVLLSHGGLQGQLDLRENSDMVRRLNRRDTKGGVALPSTLIYHAIAGKYSSNENTKGCLCGIGALFDGAPNDLVISFDSVCKPALGGDSAFKNGANRFPISGSRLLEVKRPHSELFKADKVADQLLSWLDGGL